ncbi:MAG: SH3 domain-containing protein [Candidatus Riflebacteria bacterium]|nr:SH3 domain-containing protein [Candidatus Riflebacteria bacterium]
MHKSSVCKLILIFIFSAIASFAATPEFLYVAATYVRIRDAAATSGKVVATLPIGTWAKIIEVSDKTETLLGKNEHWYKISTENQQQGWIFGGLTRVTTQENRFEVALQIITAQTKAENKNTEDLMQTLDFAVSIKELASHSTEKAQLELAFLETLDRVYSALSTAGKGDDGKHNSVKNYQNLCYYHESAGQYFVKPEAFWELAEEYADIIEAADEIAWAAATQILPGETEGDPDMMIYFFEKSYGRYIESYPEGKHVSTALEKASDIVDYVSKNLSYYESDESKEQLKKKLGWFEDLAGVTPESEARKKLSASIKQLVNGLSH